MIEVVGSPQSVTEVLCGWSESAGNRQWRITEVNGILRLEMGHSCCGNEPEHWVMCVPEGRQSFDALLAGVTNMRKKLEVARRLNGKIARSLAHAINIIQDPAVTADLLSGIGPLEHLAKVSSK